MGNIHHQGLKLKLATHGSGVYGRSGFRAFQCFMRIQMCALLLSATSGPLTKLDEVEAANHHF